MFTSYQSLDHIIGSSLYYLPDIKKSKSVLLCYHNTFKEGIGVSLIVK